MDYKAESRKHDFSKALLSTTFQEIYTKIENVDNEQSNLFKELSDLNEGGKPIKKYLL